jgi:TatD DNase family protein
VATVPSLIDSHCHLADPDFDVDREAVVARARAAGVERCLLVGVMDGSGRHARSLDLAAELAFPCAVGIHPHEAQHATEAAFEELRTLAQSRRIVGIGEIGLDYHYDLSPREVQAEAFRRQIRLAREQALPVIIHSRQAEAETLAILKEERAADVGGVMHCFTGGPEFARRVLALGLYVSFSGIVAFPKADELRAAARVVPDDRLLVETDAPYLAPPPHRGRRNEPAFVVEVACVVARARGTTLESVAQSTCDNFARCFRR